MGDIGIGLAVVLFIVISILMMLVVLIQRPQGGGLSGAFGGGGGEGAGQTAFGAKTGDVLTTVTVLIFVVFLGMAIVLNFLVRPGETTAVTATGAGTTTPAGETTPAGGTGDPETSGSFDPNATQAPGELSPGGATTPSVEEQTGLPTKALLAETDQEFKEALEEDLEKKRESGELPPAFDDPEADPTPAGEPEGSGTP